MSRIKSIKRRQLQRLLSKVLKGDKSERLLSVDVLFLGLALADDEVVNGVTDGGEEDDDDEDDEDGHEDGALAGGSNAVFVLVDDVALGALVAGLVADQNLAVGDGGLALGVVGAGNGEFVFAVNALFTGTQVNAGPAVGNGAGISGALTVLQLVLLTNFASFSLLFINMALLAATGALGAGLVDEVDAVASDALLARLVGVVVKAVVEGLVDGGLATDVAGRLAEVALVALGAGVGVRALDAVGVVVGAGVREGGGGEGEEDEEVHL